MLAGGDTMTKVSKPSCDEKCQSRPACPKCCNNSAADRGVSIERVR